MARTRSTLRRQVVGIPSACSRPKPGCTCGSTRSTPQRKAPPPQNPTRAGSHDGTPNPADISIAGARSDQKLAAIITPEANPSIESRTFLLTSRKKKTTPAPAAVRAQVPIVATRAWATG